MAFLRVTPQLSPVIHELGCPSSGKISNELQGFSQSDFILLYLRNSLEEGKGRFCHQALQAPLRKHAERCVHLMRAPSGVHQGASDEPLD